MRESPHNHDPRRRRTREALISAFILLALRRRYHEIRVDDILEASAVGRSTFYEHFASKNALLIASMDGAISIFADMPTGKVGSREIAALLSHFWDNRALARTLFQGAALSALGKTLVAKIEIRLKRDVREPLKLPHRLTAHALADGILSPVLAWLTGEAACEPSDLAIALKKSSAASLAGMLDLAQR